MIAYFSQEQFLGSSDGPHTAMPSYHFFCPSCGVVWGRIICEPGDYHRMTDNIWCAECARSNIHGIWDGVMDVHYFPEFTEHAPVEVLIHNFLQLYDNRVRLDNAGVPTQSSIYNWPDNSELLAQLEVSA